MFVVSLLSRKGGSGKTTLAVHWAVVAVKCGLSVVLADMDSQKSSASWFNKREAETPLLIQPQPSNISDHIQACRDGGINLVLIDTPPDIDTNAVYAARVSDLVVIPVRPSVLDLEAIAGTVELVRGIGKPAVFVLNQTPPRSGVTDEAKTALAAYGLPICPVALATRIAYSRALIDGRVANEIEPRGKAAIEINQSWNWIAKLLKAGSK
ncbi:AAA family ATPase [Phormidium nigroviride]